MVVLGEDLAETGQLVDICLLGGGKLSVVGDEEDKGVYVEGFLEGIKEESLS